ncbi:hypothetical protein EEB13_10805 [Rhodococcus sp. WS3]|nr:hypothetical protein EEB13_10805 [Rhodococcus sp. WS3]
MRDRNTLQYSTFDEYLKWVKCHPSPGVDRYARPPGARKSKFRPTVKGNHLAQHIDAERAANFTAVVDLEVAISFPYSDKGKPAPKVSRKRTEFTF